MKTAISGTTTPKTVEKLRDSAVDTTEVTKFEAQYKETDPIDDKLVEPETRLTIKRPKEFIPPRKYLFKPNDILMNKNGLKHYQAITNKHQLQNNNRPINLSRAAYFANAMTWPRKESKLSRLLSNLTALYARRNSKRGRRPQNVNKMSTKHEESLTKQTETWPKRMKMSKMFPTTSKRFKNTPLPSTSPTPTFETTSSLISTSTYPLFVIGLSQSTSVHSTIFHSGPAATSDITTSKATTSGQPKTSSDINISTSRKATSDSVAILNPSRQRESFSEWLQRLHSEKRQKLKEASGGILFDFK